MTLNHYLAHRHIYEVGFWVLLVGIHTTVGATSAPSVPNLNLAVPNIGGPIVTASGLIFIAATAAFYLRAFDIRTGTELWKRRPPRGR